MSTYGRPSLHRTFHLYLLARLSEEHTLSLPKNVVFRRPVNTVPVEETTVKNCLGFRVKAELCAYW